MWKVMRPSGSLRMFVIHTGSPPPSWLLLDGIVYGVKLLFEELGKGTIDGNELGPRAPSTPCDSSTSGRLFTTRHTMSPSPGNCESAPICLRFSRRKYSLPSARTITLKHCVGSSSIGASTSFCLMRGSSTVGLTQPSCSLLQAQKCCGRPLPIWLDMAHHCHTPSLPGRSGWA